MSTNPDAPRRGLYRSRRGLILGVCTGLAESLDLSVFWTRVLAAVLLLLTGAWPMLALYFGAALLMKPEPVLPFRSPSDREFYDSYVSSRSLALGRVRETYENLRRRIQRLEHTVTSAEYDWDRRLRE